MTPVRMAALLAPLLALALFVACGANDDGSGRSEIGASPTAISEMATAVPTLMSESSPSPSSGGANDDYDYDTDSSPAADGSATPAAPGAGDARETEIEDFAFEQSLTVPVGTTVRWTNRDSAPHRISSVDQVFSSATLNEGDSFEFAFEEAGTHDYICTIHPEMTGTVTVE